MATNSDVITGLFLGFGLGSLVGGLLIGYTNGINNIHKARIQGITTEYIIVEKQGGKKYYYEYSPTKNTYTSFEPTTLVNKVEGELEKKVENK